MLKIRSHSVFSSSLSQMVMNKLIEPELKPVPPRGDIFVLYCSYYLQQEWLNQFHYLLHVYQEGEDQVRPV